MPPRWTSSDALLLLAFGTGVRRARRLSSVLSTADAVKHEIPTRDQVERAVKRLTGAGLLVMSNGRFSVTPDGRQLLQMVRDRPPAEKQAALVQLLAAFDVPGGGEELDPAEYDAALEAYRARTE